MAASRRPSSPASREMRAGVAAWVLPVGENKSAASNGRHRTNREPKQGKTESAILDAQNKFHGLGPNGLIASVLTARHRMMREFYAPGSCPM